MANKEQFFEKTKSQKGINNNVLSKELIAETPDNQQSGDSQNKINNSSKFNSSLQQINARCKWF